MIKLTNATYEYRGEPLWLNPDHIVSVYEKAEASGGSLQTKVYGSTGQEWTVEESPKQVVALMNPHNNLLQE